MNPTLIKDCGYSLPANARRLWSIPVSLDPGLTLASWASFQLILREDPGWPRSGSTLFLPLDPPNAGGTPLLTVAGVPDLPPGTNITFDMIVPANPGRKRYAFTVIGIGGAAGRSPIVEYTWLTVTPGE